MAQAGEARLAAGLEALGLAPRLAPALLAYRDLLARWNRVYNLSAVRDPDAMIERHLLDSLAVLPYLPPGALLDVGSGGGLPGVPIAIAEPERALTLLEANGKKARFLRQAVLELGLAGATVAGERLQAHRGGPYRVVICRAFSGAPAFWRDSAHLLGVRGVAVAMKGRQDDAELAALSAEGVSCRVQRLAVPGLDAERHLLVLAAGGPEHRTAS